MKDFAYIVTIVLFASLSCSKHTSSCVTEQKADTANRMIERVDSYHTNTSTRDSTKETVIIREKVDTVGNILQQTIYREVYREHNNNAEVKLLQSVIDSLMCIQSTKTTVPQPVVASSASWWRTITHDVGAFVLGLITTVIAIAVIWLAKKYKR